MARASSMLNLLRYTKNPNFSLSKKSHIHTLKSQPNFFCIKDKIKNLIKTCQYPTQFPQIHTHFITLGVFHNPSMAGRLLKLSLVYCDFNYTLSIFKYIHFPDTFCVNTVIKAFVSCNNKDVVRFYFQMLGNDKVLFKPNSDTFSCLISWCTKTGDLRSGKECHGQSVKFGVDRYLFVENALIHMYGCFGENDVAWKVFDEMSEKDIVSWNSMVSGYVKIGEMGIAHKLFDEMPKRNVVSWNALMKGYLDWKNPGMVLKLFRKMVKEGVKGNDTTVVSVVTACGRSCRLKEGKSVHGFAVRMLTDMSLIIGTVFVDMYCRCGRSDVAQFIFDGMLVKNLVCWNAMITGQSIHGNPKHGLQLFHKMLKLADVMPDEVTYVGVLCACARLDLLTEGKNYFLEMTEVFYVKPNFAHYWCMANIYGSHGLVNDAVEFLKTMPVDINMSPKASFWAGLLGSCRFQGDMSVGEVIAKALIEDDPLNHTFYVLLYIIHAVAGRWDEVARMKCMMKETGVSVPGFGLVELTQIVNSLEVGDKLEDRIYTLHDG